MRLRSSASPTAESPSCSGPPPPLHGNKMLSIYSKRETQGCSQQCFENCLESPLLGKRLLRELLDAGDVVSTEAHKNRFRRRLPVNPVLDVNSVGVTLAYFVIWLPDCRDHFLAIHSHDRPAILDGLLHFRWQRIKPLHRCRALFRKVQERRQQFLQIVRCEIGNRLAKF